MKKLLAIFLCLMGAAHGAISASTVWEVRTLGNANNGGAFVTGSSGTDRSQSNTAFCTATDLVLVSTTTATSVSCPFSAASVGNLIQITAGTNCTVGFYQVVSVATVTATLDRAAGTLACVAGTFALGGAITSPVVAGANMINGNVVYMKADGTYTTTTSAVFTNNSVATANIQLLGYTTTRGDNGRVTWTTSTNSLVLINSEALAFTIANFNLSSTAGTRGVGISITQRPSGNYIQNVKLDGFSNGFQAFSGLFNLTMVGVEVLNSTSDGVITSLTGATASAQIVNCYFHDNASSGLVFNETGLIFVYGSVFSRNTNDGFHIDGQTGSSGGMATYMLSSIFSENSGDGFEYAINGNGRINIFAQNSIFYSNTGVGLKSGNVPSAQVSLNNAFGANGTARQNFDAGAADVTLTADPFVSKATGNYALNATAGGGAALKSVGFPGISLFGTGFLDIGALQSAGGAAASVRVFGSAQ